MSTADRTPELFTVLATFVEEQLGLRYSWDDRYLLLDKVDDRVLELGVGSLLQYYYLLRYDDPEGKELAALADVLSVGETYLFREADALLFIADHVIPAVLKARGRARVWSAGCSTGEEVYSLAMLLASRGTLDKVTVVGTDLSQRSIMRARSGSVPVRSLERSPLQHLATPYVHRRDNRLFFSPTILEQVSFDVVNLLDEAALRAQPVADVILLRNVLIYFSAPTIRRVVLVMLERLRDDGLLFVGVSDSLMRQDLPLECQESGGVFYYRKAERP